jgi:hypothetical protein
LPLQLIRLLAPSVVAAFSVESRFGDIWAAVCAWHHLQQCLELPLMRLACLPPLINNHEDRTITAMTECENTNLIMLPYIQIFRIKLAKESESGTSITL